MSDNKENLKGAMDSKSMLKENAKAGRKVFYTDRMTVEILKDTKFYKQGQIVRPHRVMGEQLIKEKIGKEIK